MKKILILSLLAVGLTGCHHMDRTPYNGGMGEYGFTYDLDGTPSPFKDTSYRPLTPYDLAAPTIIVVTNPPPPTANYETAPAPAISLSNGTPTTEPTGPGTSQIFEASGAGLDDTTSQSAGANAPASGDRTVAGAPGAAVGFSDDSATNVTNNVTNNFAATNFPGNSTNFPTNNFPTNRVPTNRLPTQPGQVPPPAINEPSGAPTQSFDADQPPSTIPNDQTSGTNQTDNVPPAQPTPPSAPAPAPANP